MIGTHGNHRSTAKRGAMKLLFVAALPARSETRPDAARSAPLPPAIQFALRHAVHRLSRPECQLVYSDFSDSRGKTLTQNLAERGQSAAEQLQELSFEDADRSSLCLRGRVLAFASPESRTVRLCTQRFTRAVFDRSGIASAILIHEQLHTLGLRENPPTPREITDRVLERCGR